MTEASWTEGRDHGLVWAGGVAMVDASVPLAVVNRVFAGLRAGAPLDAFINALADATGDGLLGLPPFAAAVAADGQVRLAARGRFTSAADLADGSTTAVTGADTTTWAERRLSGVAVCRLGADDVLDRVTLVGERPIGTGVVPCATLATTLALAGSEVDDETVRRQRPPVVVPTPPSPVPTGPDGADFISEVPGFGTGGAASGAPSAPPVPPAPPTLVPPPAVPSPVPPPVPPAVAAYAGDHDGHTVAQAFPDHDGLTAAPAAEQAWPDHDGHTVARNVPGRDAVTTQRAAEHAAVDHDGHTAATPPPGAERGQPAPGGEPKPAWLAASEVVAATCPAGHANPPHRSVCRVCGAPVAGDPVRMPRPSLGRVVASTGEALELTAPVIVGRAPRAARFQGHEVPQLMTVPEPHVSSSHVALRIDGWSLLAVDLQSSNGTFLRRHGQPPTRLLDQPQLLVPGDVIDLGHGIHLRFEELP